MTNGSLPEGLYETASKLAQSGELRALIGQLMQNNTAPADRGDRQNDAASVPSASRGDPQNTPADITGGSGALPFDPSVLASLITPEMMSSLPSILSALGGRGDGSRTVAPPDEKPGESSHRRCGEKERRALLSALRPFLSDNRRRALDMMIGIEQLGMAGKGS